MRGSALVPPAGFEPATRFRKSLDSAYYAVYLRLSYARDSQPSRHTTPDDPGSRHKPCHEARLLPALTRPIITSELRRSGEAHASQLWGFKSEEGLDHYAHVLNQHKLLVVG